MNPGNGTTNSGRPSPVDQILASPQTGPALLDTAPSAPVPKWLWLLPAVLLLPGGVIGWVLVRDSNRTAGRAMLIAGVAFTVVTVLSVGALGSLSPTALLHAFGM